MVEPGPLPEQPEADTWRAPMVASATINLLREWATDDQFGIPADVISAVLDIVDSWDRAGETEVDV